jgi:hypothetical protein
MPAAIFNNDAVKILKNKLRFKDGTDLTNTKITELNDLTLPAGPDTLVARTSTDILTNKTLTDALLTAGGTLDVTAAGNFTIAGSLGANVLTLGGASSTVTIPGSMQVQGTLTWVDTTDLRVTDNNIEINFGGNDISAEGAGISIVRTGTDGSLVYEDALASKFKLGALGSEVEIANVSSTQSFSNKSIDADTNTITNIDNNDIKAAAAIAVNKLAATTGNRALVSDASGFIAASSATDTELGYVSGVTSSIQTQLNSKAVIEDVFKVASSSGTFTAVADTTHIVNTSSTDATVTLPAAAANRFVRIKDNGNANTNNILVNPASGNIDGSSEDTRDSDYASVVYVSDGTDWYKL